MGQADEKIYKMLMDEVVHAADFGVFDVYVVLESFYKRLDSFTEYSMPARRYQQMTREVLDRNPRVQRKLEFG